MCSNIQSFKATPGYYPGTKIWGAIWTSLSLRSCDPAVEIHGVLSGVQLSPAGPDRALLPYYYTGVMPAYTIPANTSVTIDWEPIELESQFQVEIDVFNSAGELIESRSATVSTPAPVVSTTTSTAG